MSIRMFNFRAFVLVGLVTVTMLASLVQPATAGEKDKIGRIIAPVPLNLKGKSHSLVFQGSYLVNAASGCNDCHTNPSYAPGYDPFQGEEELINTAHYLAGGRHFGPTLVSPNITPDSEGKPAGLTRAEFIQLMRTGHDPHDGHILQVMPWPIFRKLTDRDLSSIYEYLRAIPHAEPGP
ncbi:MAG: cytochrome C [Deltaproteobacteria bacterium]|nr:cytochrome C [Deltaproteobacteria bacterium]